MCASSDSKSTVQNSKSFKPIYNEFLSPHQIKHNWNTLLTDASIAVMGDGRWTMIMWDNVDPISDHAAQMIKAISVVVAFTFAWSTGSQI